MLAAGLFPARQAWKWDIVRYAITDGKPEERDAVMCRRAMLQERDIVVHLKLSQYLKEKLAACQATHGQAFNAAFSQLPPNVAVQLRGALGEDQ